MPLLEVIQSRKVSATIQLTDSTATQLDQYAAFIRATADNVVEQALQYVFGKDREFQDFLKTENASKITPTLRVRKAAKSSVIPGKPERTQDAAKAARTAEGRV
jgi:hypothetical protein